MSRREYIRAVVGRLLAALFVALLVVLPAVLPPTVAAAAPAGFDLFPRSCGWISPEAQIDHAVSPGLSVAKFQIGEAFSTDPLDVRRAIDNGARTIILRTDDGLKGYSYQEVQRLIESPGGIAGFSYGTLMHQYEWVEWWIEVGNEPDNAGIDPWAARWWALALYKELATNELGHIDEPWRTKYPMLRWAVSLPTKADQADVMLQWLGGHEIDSIGAGGVRDHYDAVATHLYGWYEVLDGGGSDWVRIYDQLLADPHTRAVLITEFGIDDRATPDLVKVDRYRAFLATTPPKVKAATVFAYCVDGFPQYTLGDTSGAVERLAP